jgi:hypothetical protein
MRKPPKPVFKLRKTPGPLVKKPKRKLTNHSKRLKNSPRRNVLKPIKQPRLNEKRRLRRSFRNGIRLSRTRKMNVRLLRNSKKMRRVRLTI